MPPRIAASALRRTCSVLSQQLAGIAGALDAFNHLVEPEELAAVLTPGQRRNLDELAAALVRSGRAFRRRFNLSVRRQRGEDHGPKQ
jgi:hypothetical protein